MRCGAVAAPLTTSPPRLLSSPSPAAARSKRQHGPLLGTTARGSQDGRERRRGEERRERRRGEGESSLAGGTGSVVYPDLLSFLSHLFLVVFKSLLFLLAALRAPFYQCQQRGSPPAPRLTFFAFAAPWVPFAGLCAWVFAFMRLSGRCCCSLAPTVSSPLQFDFFLTWNPRIFAFACICLSARVCLCVCVRVCVCVFLCACRRSESCRPPVTVRDSKR